MQKVVKTAKVEQQSKLFELGSKVKTLGKPYLTNTRGQAIIDLDSLSREIPQIRVNQAECSLLRAKASTWKQFLVCRTDHLFQKLSLTSS